MFEGSYTYERAEASPGGLNLSLSTLTVFSDTTTHAATRTASGTSTIHYMTWVSVQTRDATGAKVVGDISDRLGLVITDMHDMSVIVPTRVGRFILQGAGTGLYKALVVTTRASELKVTLQFDGKAVSKVRGSLRITAPVSEARSSIEAIDNDGKITRFVDMQKCGEPVKVRLHLCDNDGNAITGLPINDYTVKLHSRVGTMYTLINSKIREEGGGVYTFEWKTPTIPTNTAFSCAISAEICYRVTVGKLVVRYTPKPNYHTKDKK